MRIAYSEDEAERIEAEVRAKQGDDAELLIVMFNLVGPEAKEGFGEVPMPNPLSFYGAPHLSVGSGDIPHN